jgi:translation initiation factor eIF-2B subunit beta
MRLMVTNQKYADAASLIDEIRAVGHKIQSAKPSELAIGNIVRRVLHIVREEAQQDATELEDGDDDDKQVGALFACST